MANHSHYLLGMVLSFALLGCGKFGPPLPPEAFAPKAVENLETSVQMEGVTLRWQSPSENRRGQELAAIDGYAVYRSLIDDFESYIEDPFDASEKLAFLPDTHIAVRDELRDAAREKGLPTRKIKVDGTLRMFSYLDKDLEPGREYVYMIVPMNQDGEEGEVSQYIRILFRGDSSEVRIIDQSTLVGEL